MEANAQPTRERITIEEKINVIDESTNAGIQVESLTQAIDNLKQIINDTVSRDVSMVAAALRPGHCS
jgi:hypothetical protein